MHRNELGEYTMTRLSLVISKDLDKAISVLATKNGITRAELIRTALAVYSFLAEETENGNKMAIVDSENNITSTIVLPCPIVCKE
jgi:hypothetical protein